MNEFRSVCPKTAYERERDYGNRPLFKKLKIQFDSDEEIQVMIDSLGHKSNVRNQLGIRTAEDWIYNLNIGNVMLLS